MRGVAVTGLLRRLTLTLLLCTGFNTGVLADETATDDEPEYSRTGADTCARCHDEDSDFPVVDIFLTPHAIPGDQRTPFAQAQCESCHGPGGAHAGRVRRGQERPEMINFGRDKETPADEQNAMCTGCHATQLGTGWHGGTHEAAGLVCADCHKVHAARDPVANTAQQPQVCFECHTAQKAASQRYSSHPVRQGKMACGDCHNAHGTLTEHSLHRDNLNDSCYQCHAEKRGPFLWEHAPVTEDCSLCHRSHGSNHPALLTRRAPLLCQQCHSQQGHPAVARTPAGLGRSSFVSASGCVNCHVQVHGSNHPSGAVLTR